MHYVDLARARSARGEVVLRERRDSDNPDENPDEAPEGSDKENDHGTH